MSYMRDLRRRDLPLGPRIEGAERANSLLDLTNSQWSVVAVRTKKRNLDTNSEAKDGTWEVWSWNGELGTSDMADFGSMVAAGVVLTVQRRTGKKCELLAKYRREIRNYGAATEELREFLKPSKGPRAGRNPVSRHQVAAGVFNDPS